MKKLWSGKINPAQAALVAFEISKDKSFGRGCAGFIGKPRPAAAKLNYGYIRYFRIQVFKKNLDFLVNSEFGTYQGQCHIVPATPQVCFSRRHDMALTYQGTF